MNSEFDIKNGQCLVCGYDGGMDIVYHQPRGESCVFIKKQKLLENGGEEAIQEIVIKVLEEKGLL